jgi:magnesium transporter
MAQLDACLRDIMIKRVITLPETAKVYDACELFITHRLLALPVVDEKKRLTGVVDVSLLSEEVFDAAERRSVDDVFQVIGVRMSQLQVATPWTAFRFRAPWLLATVTGGLCCALIASLFEATLHQSISLALFFALVLAFGESVAMQSLTIMVQTLHGKDSADFPWGKVAREFATCTLIGVAFGLLVGVIVWLWRGESAAALSIGLSIVVSATLAGGFGIAVPLALKRLNKDPNVAAGPIALALADATTTLIYFCAAFVSLALAKGN